MYFGQMMILMPLSQKTSLPTYENDICYVNMQVEDYGYFQDFLVTVPTVARNLLQEQVQIRSVISLILVLR